MMASDEALVRLPATQPLPSETQQTATAHDMPREQDDPLEDQPQLTLTIHHRGAPLEVTLPAHSSLSDLSKHVADILSIPPQNQKFMITPKVGTLKPPFDPEHDRPLSTLVAKKIVLMGSSTSEISTLSTQLAAATAPRKPSPIKPATPSRRRDWRKAKEESQYTFHHLEPLRYFRDPERSLRFLERLRDDPGIKAAMVKHKFSVGLLTEMDPAMHTTHESRTLGLNRNRGEVIELRLRTDAFDGYRDYKTIRKTLCHELAHNVWGPHDRNFWELCKEIEREVERADWTRGGRRLGEEEFYNPQDDGVGDDHVDSGGWQGGDYVLGGGESGVAGLSRREILAKAVDERRRRENDSQMPRDGSGDGDSSAPGSRPGSRPGTPSNTGNESHS